MIHIKDERKGELSFAPIDLSNAGCFGEMRILNYSFSLKSVKNPCSWHRFITSLGFVLKNSHITFSEKGVWVGGSATSSFSNLPRIV
ncbi:MAG: hypothetical protein KUL83_01525 [Lentimicrobium sp.]|jgi:hypothetical protein|nr:hypothetical protein [Lentimicrobium sp.]MDD2526461.1 hypothetical protein [Lentimicrobiaceae bacterium]